MVGRPSVDSFSWPSATGTWVSALLVGSGGGTGARLARLRQGVSSGCGYPLGIWRVLSRVYGMPRRARPESLGAQGFAIRRGLSVLVIRRQGVSLESKHRRPSGRPVSSLGVLMNNRVLVDSRFRTPRGRALAL